MDEAVFVDSGGDSMAVPVLVAAGKVERDTLRGDAAGAHLIAAGEDIEQAGNGGDADVRLLLPAGEPSAESGGVRDDVGLDAEGAQAAGDAIDGAGRIAGGAGDVGALDMGAALGGFCATHASGEQEDFVCCAVEGFAQAPIHDFGGDHVEVVLRGGATAEEAVFTEATMRVVAVEEGLYTAGIGTEAMGGVLSKLVE